MNGILDEIGRIPTMYLEHQTLIYRWSKMRRQLQEISDDEQNMEKENEDEGLSLPPHRYIQNEQASNQRTKRAGR